MKFIIFFLPFLAVSAQSAPSLHFQRRGEGTPNTDPWPEIEKEENSLREAFAAANIDIVKYYCDGFGDRSIVNQVANITDLYDNIVRFKELVEPHVDYASKFFCGTRVDYTNFVAEENEEPEFLFELPTLEEEIEDFVSTATAEDFAKIEKEYNDLLDAFADQDIGLTEHYCENPGNDEFYDQFQNNREIQDRLLDFMELAMNYGFGATLFFCGGLMDKLIARGGPTVIVSLDVE